VGFQTETTRIGERVAEVPTPQPGPRTMARRFSSSLSHVATGSGWSDPWSLRPPAAQVFDQPPTLRLPNYRADFGVRHRQAVVRD